MVEDNVLTIKGERKFEEKVDSERYYRVERRFGSFKRKQALPAGVNADDIQAHYEDGILEVRVPQGGGREAQEGHCQRHADARGPGKADEPA